MPEDADNVPLFSAVMRCPKLVDLTVKDTALGLHALFALCSELGSTRCLHSLVLDLN